MVLVEGQTYRTVARVTNRSTRSGAPVAVEFDIAFNIGSASRSYLSTVKTRAFGAGEALDVPADFTVPVGEAGQTGTIAAQVRPPGSMTVICEGSLTFSVSAPLVYAATAVITAIVDPVTGLAIDVSTRPLVAGNSYIVCFSVTNLSKLPSGALASATLIVGVAAASYDARGIVYPVEPIAWDGNRGGSGFSQAFGPGETLRWWTGSPSVVAPAGLPKFTIPTTEKGKGGFVQIMVFDPSGADVALPFKTFDIS